MKKRALVFGTGNNFIYGCTFLEDNYRIIGLTDNAKDKIGKCYLRYEVKKIEDYPRDSYDVIILTPNRSAEIRKQLIDYGIDETDIIDLGDALNSEETRAELKIAVLLYGGMGDYIIGKNWLYLLNREYEIGKETVHIYSDKGARDTIESLFWDCDWVTDKRTITYDSSSLLKSAYDLVFRFSILPYVQEMKDEKVFRCNKKLYQYASDVREYGLKNYEYGFFSTPYFYKTMSAIIAKYPKKKYHTYFDVLEDLGVSDDFICDIPVKDGTDYLDKLGLKQKQFITIDTGLNQEYLTKPNVRAWRWRNWDLLSQKIKKKYPDFMIVQIGLSSGECENICADLNLNGKTNLEQVKALLKEAYLHIDYEGGLVHLRHVLGGGTSIVLMGPTSEQVHNYSENIAVRTNECIHSCEWQGRDWLTNCQKGFASPRCMQSITPELVMKKVDEFMRSRQGMKQ